MNAVSMGLQLLQSEIGKVLAVGVTRKDEPKISSEEPNRAERTCDIMTENLKEWSCLSEDILSNATSAVDVLNDLLNYDKIETGTLVLELGVVPIWELIDRTASEFVLQARQKNVNFDSHFDTNLLDFDTEGGIKSWSKEAKQLKVIGDHIRISQVLRNLISNGLKFTPETGKYLKAVRRIFLFEGTHAQYLLTLLNFPCCSRQVNCRHQMASKKGGIRHAQFPCIGRRGR